MKLHYDSAEAQLYVRLCGEIDHHSSARLRTEIDNAIFTHSPRTLVLDFQDVTFMDSSGIGLIMGRYRVLQPLGGEIILAHPVPHIKRILRLAGMERLAAIRNDFKNDMKSELKKETVQ